jgi:hypothetical protein
VMMASAISVVGPDLCSYRGELNELRAPPIKYQALYSKLVPPGLLCNADRFLGSRYR